jgi:hypothetical protein
MYGSVGMANPMTTTQDLIVGGASGAPQRLALGPVGDALIVAGGSTVAWGTVDASIAWPLTAHVDETFEPNDIANNVLDLHNNTSAVNGITVTGTATGTSPSIAATGIDANLGIHVALKGAGALLVDGGTGVNGQVLLTNGNPINAVNGAQLEFGYNGTTNYPAWLASQHNAGGAAGNRVLVYTGDGTQVGTFPGNAVLGLTVENGHTCTPQSAAAAAIATGGTITTAGPESQRVNPAAAVTGIILAAGTVAGQRVTVVNESAFTVTFAASGTSNVADGTSDVIAATTARSFVWDSVQALWFPTASATVFPLTNSGDETFQPNSIANNALDLHNNASAVNGITVTGTATTVAPILSTAGTDASVSLSITCKGMGTVTITPATTVTGQITANGGVNIAGALQMGGANGTTGQFLQTNGNATPSWVSDTVGGAVAYSSDPRIVGGLSSQVANYSANQARFVRVMHGGGSCAHVAIDVGTSSGNISVGFYTNTGTQDSAAPNTLVQSSGAVACPSAGFASVAVTAVAVIQGQHWIAMSCDNTTATFSRAFANTANFCKGLCTSQATAHPLPASAGTLVTISTSMDLVGVA